jgi:hypothetical protein
VQYLVSVIDDGAGSATPAEQAVIEASDLDVALRLAAEGSTVCNRKVEVRPFL